MCQPVLAKIVGSISSRFVRLQYSPLWRRLSLLDAFFGMLSLVPLDGMLVILNFGAH